MRTLYQFFLLIWADSIFHCDRFLPPDPVINKLVLGSLIPRPFPQNALHLRGCSPDLWAWFNYGRKQTGSCFQLVSAVEGVRKGRNTAGRYIEVPGLQRCVCWGQPQLVEAKVFPLEVVPFHITEYSPGYVPRVPALLSRSPADQWVSLCCPSTNGLWRDHAPNS